MSTHKVAYMLHWKHTPQPQLMLMMEHISHHSCASLALYKCQSMLLQKNACRMHTRLA